MKMKKLLSLFLGGIMLASAISVPAFAAVDGKKIKESASGFYYVEADGKQAELSASDKDIFIEADGLIFKDHNGNGKLDLYEDWRLTIEERAQNLVSLMTIEEKAGALGFGCIAGSNGVIVVDVDKDEITYNEDFYFDEGEGTSLTGMGGSRYRASMYYQVENMGVTTFIAAMTGLPKDQLDYFNKLQALGEDTRLGIPLTFSGDRSYNTWGGLIDMAHYAMGVADDPDLLYNLASEYSKESFAIGYHQVFHGYGDEIGAWYGDEVNYIAQMTDAETRAYDDFGMQSHTKHFIARGGRNSYVNALNNSPANLLGSWMVGWKAAVDAGTRWIMTNNNVGITPGLQAYMDKATFDLLRVDLGYDGVVVLDWPLDGVNSLMLRTGITRDGVDVSELNLSERYALILNAGIDMFSCYVAVPGTAEDNMYNGIGYQRYFPEELIAAVENGDVTMERVDLSVYRVMLEKFRLDIFENPYRDWEEALFLIGSPEYQEEQFEINTIYDINDARRQLITNLEEQLMTQSTILLKNDNNLLPLAKNTKIYYWSNNSSMMSWNPDALAVYGEIVDDIDDADVILLHVTSLNDAYADMRDDALDTGKPMILMAHAGIGYTTQPGPAELESFDAILMPTYINTPDHGTTTGDFYRYVYPHINAEMLFGLRTPGGKTVYEIGYTADDYLLSWYELGLDIGADSFTRLYMAAQVMQDPTYQLANNLGDVIWPNKFGMKYGMNADIYFSTLVVPREVGDVEGVDRQGNPVINRVAMNSIQKDGVPFEIMFIAFNDGYDGHATAEVYDGDELIASKFVSVCGGSFTIVRMEITLEGAGEHTITVDGLSAVITVEK